MYIFMYLQKEIDSLPKTSYFLILIFARITGSRIVHLNFRAETTFPVPVCTVPHGLWVNKADNQQLTSRFNKVDTVRLFASYSLG